MIGRIISLFPIFIGFIGIFGNRTILFRLCFQFFTGIFHDPGMECCCRCETDYKEGRQKIEKPDAQKSRQTKHQRYQKEERKVRHGKNKCSFHGREHFHLKTGNYRIECKIVKKYNAAGNNQKNTVKNRDISPSGLQHKAPVKEHKTDKNNLD